MRRGAARHITITMTRIERFCVHRTRWEGKGSGRAVTCPSPRDAVGGGHLMAERMAAAAPATSDAL